MRPKSVVLQSRKKLQVLEINFFRKKKKILPAYLCRYDLQNGERNFLKNKWGSKYISFGEFKIPTNCSSQ